MTASAPKINDPQVRMLETMVRPGGTYLEVGCGGGAVCHHLAGMVRTVGMDVSQLALAGARDRAENETAYVCAAGDAIPLRGSSVDGAYAFEVLEHVWDPPAVMAEMVRVTKPGGFLLVSFPNGFSLDLYLEKTTVARLFDMVLAIARYVMDRVTRRSFYSVEPGLDGRVYADCDMITAIVPANLARQVERMGCRVDSWDTTTMYAQSHGATASASAGRFGSWPLFRHFGDHVLMVAHKREGAV